MSWLTLVLGLVKWVWGRFFSPTSDPLAEGVKSGIAQARDKEEGAGLEEINKAEEARDGTDVGSALHPERLRGEDQFSRD